ncbi:MAG: M67 family metallopeptidase [Planctomycetes bacterium]|nr:M67 family metallopeptidase [Planctomycetota bacterium]
MAFRLEVPCALYAAMLEQARAELPNECCGLLAGTVEGGVGRVVARYPLVNELASPVEFTGEARGQFEACRDMRRQGIEELAVYHSHPTTAPLPSRKDRKRNYSENVVNLIISLAGPEPVVRGWWLTATDFREAEWKIIE